MDYSYFSKFGTPKTPKAIRYLLIFIAFFSLGSTILSIFLPPTHLLQPSFLFSLSLAGIKQGFVFQLLTYPFLILPEFYFNLSYLFHLGFNLYVIWIFGSQMVERIGEKRFLLFILLATLVTGALSLASMLLLNTPTHLAGTTSLLYALLLSWITLFGNVRLLLFFIFPLSALHVILGILGINLLIDLLYQKYLLSLSYLFAACFGYLFPLLVWKQHSPFHLLHGFERVLFTLNFRFKKKSRSYQPSKIYDIKTGEPVLDDEQFLEAILSKISLYGEEGLSSKEKKRLNEISRKRR